MQTKGNQQSSPPPPISLPLSISLNLQSICFISWCQPSSGCMTCDLCNGDLSRAHRMSGQHPSQKHLPLCVFSFYQSVQYALHLILPFVSNEWKFDLCWWERGGGGGGFKRDKTKRQTTSFWPRDRPTDIISWENAPLIWPKLNSC